MTLYGIIFYLLAFVMIVATALAVTRTRLVHAVVFLVISFFSTALLFYLLGAPFLAALEVIIYAGAIMVMFLFMIMTLKMEGRQKREASLFRPWSAAMVLGGISLILLGALLWAGPGHGLPLRPAMASPLEFGRFIFSAFWFSVEVASFLLFVALVGALYLGRGKGREKDRRHSPQEAS
jgi:NADH-quinone oxidoreductase subunit J